MGVHFADNAITAKIRSIYGRRITAAQYDELCHKKNTAEIAAYLKEHTHYGQALAGIQPATVRSGQLENVLQKSGFQNYMDLIRYASPKSRDFYRAYLLGQTEVQLILQMIRLLNTGHAEDFITSYPAFAEERLGISLERMARARSFDELLQALEHTAYHDLLLPYRPVADDDQGHTRPIDYTGCEAALTAHYYDEMRRLIARSFSGRTRAQLEEIFGLKVGLENLILVYRFKRFYPDTPIEEVRRYLLPFWGQAPRRQFEELLAAKSPEAFLEQAKNIPTVRRQVGEDFAFLEYGSQTVRYKLSRRYIRFAQDAPTAFAAFMFLSDMEAQNIVRIVEAVRYGMDPADIAKLLVID